MKKFLKGVLIILAFIILIILIYVLVTFPPIMGGMAAKTMCSCVYVTGRSPESVILKELQVFPGLANINLELNNRDSTVTATLLWQTSKAIYRKGLGCTLLSEAAESEIRKQRFNIHHSSYVRQDTIPWPTGDLNAFTSDSTLRKEIGKIVDDAFTEKDPENPVNTHAVVVMYNGKIISEKYAEGLGPNSILMGWSMTKSITNALTGILVKEGKLHVADPAPVEAWQGDERKHVTLNHLLQASSGLGWSESYFIPGADFHNMFIHSDDKAAYAESRKLEHVPGEFFQYSSGTTNILSKIIRETVGEEKYHRFPYDCLFSRIGMHHAGLLYLNDGVWNGQRILPEGWVKYSTTPAPATKRREYGAQIWLNYGEEGNPENVEYAGVPREAIIFDGFEKNFVVIIPSRNLVVVRLGVTHNGNFNLGNLVAGIVALLPDGE